MLTGSETNIEIFVDGYDMINISITFTDAGISGAWLKFQDVVDLLCVCGGDLNSFTIYRIFEE